MQVFKILSLSILVTFGVTGTAKEKGKPAKGTNLFEQLNKLGADKATGEAAPTVTLKGVSCSWAHDLKAKNSTCTYLTSKGVPKNIQGKAAADLAKAIQEIGEIEKECGNRMCGFASHDVTCREGSDPKADCNIGLSPVAAQNNCPDLVRPTCKADEEIKSANNRGCTVPVCRKKGFTCPDFSPPRCANGIEVRLNADNCEQPFCKDAPKSKDDSTTTN